MFFAPAIRRDSSLAPIARDLPFDRFMGDTLRGFWGLGLDEDDKSWTLSLDVPGVAKEHLNVSVDGTTVLIETTRDAGRQYRMAYELPGEADPDQAEARLQDGVLTLRLGKADVRNRRRIAIS